jgi:hypothetical protein
MYIEIVSNKFHKTIPCPNNTITIGLKYNGKSIIADALHLLIENLKYQKHTLHLPDKSKISFYFYYSDDPTLLEIADMYKDLQILHFQKNDITIVSRND